MATVEIIPETIQLIRMSDEEYFSDKYKDYISNSKLNLIDPNKGGSMDKFLDGYVSKYSESFALGGAIHCMLLQPDDFIISTLHKPTGKLGEFVNEVFKLRKKGYTINGAINKAKIIADYYANSLSTNRIKTAIKKSLSYYLGRIHEPEYTKEVIYLSAANQAKLNDSLKSIGENKNFNKILAPKGLLEDAEVYNEYAILCEIRVDDVLLKIKAKLDNFTVNHETQEIVLNDLKSTGKPVSFFMGNYVKILTEDKEETRWFSGSFQKYNYYRQMGLYVWLLNAVMKQLLKLNYKLKVNMLVVETFDKHRTAIYPINGNYIKKGLEEFKQLITTVAYG